MGVSQAARAAGTPSPRRIAAWQGLRVWEEDPERYEELRLRAMEALEFKRARKRRRKRLQRLHLDELHELKPRPPAGALAIVELLAMAVSHHGKSGLMVPHQ